jgi:hypothetical protein
LWSNLKNVLCTRKKCIFYCSWVECHLGQVGSFLSVYAFIFCLLVFINYYLAGLVYKLRVSCLLASSSTIWATFSMLSGFLAIFQIWSHVFDQVDLRPWSSYLYFPCSWIGRHALLYSIYLLKWGIANFLPRWASYHDPTDLSLKYLGLQVYSIQLASIIDTQYWHLWEYWICIFLKVLLVWFL